MRLLPSIFGFRGHRVLPQYCKCIRRSGRTDTTALHVARIKLSKPEGSRRGASHTCCRPGSPGSPPTRPSNEKVEWSADISVRWWALRLRELLAQPRPPLDTSVRRAPFPGRRPAPPRRRRGAAYRPPTTAHRLPKWAWVDSNRSSPDLCVKVERSSSDGVRCRPHSARNQ